MVWSFNYNFNKGVVDYYVADITTALDSAKCYFETYPFKVQNLHWLIPILKSLEFEKNELLRIHNRYYYPFGSPMDGRTFYSEKYRFGFNGLEKENEISGIGNYSFFKYRVSDNRLGRFFAIDPLASKYPFNSTYAFSENRVIDCVELEGLESVQAGRMVAQNYLYHTGVYDEATMKAIEKQQVIQAMYGEVTTVVAADILITKEQFTRMVTKNLIQQYAVFVAVNLFKEGRMKENVVSDVLRKSFYNSLNDVDVADAAFSTFIKTPAIATLLSSSLDVTIDKDGKIKGESIIDNKSVVSFGVDLIVNTLLDEAKGILPKNMKAAKAINIFIDALGVDTSNLLKKIDPSKESEVKTEK